MRYQIKQGQLEKISTGCLVVPVVGERAAWKKMAGSFPKRLNQLTDGTLLDALLQGDLPTKVGRSLLLPAPKKLKAERLLLVYAGETEHLTVADGLRLAKQVALRLKGINAREAHFAWHSLTVADQSPEWLIRRVVTEIEAATYQFTVYKKKVKRDSSKLESISITAPGSVRAASRALEEAHAIACAIRFVKDLGNTPANECTPVFLAKSARKLAAEDAKMSVQVLDETRMKALNMGSLLSVTAGTKEPARLIVLKYKGTRATEKPIVFVGKGITFDSGGISLKPPGKMDEMKFDMSGAGTTIGLFRMLIDLQLPVNVVGIVAAAENMPSDRATKPGDVVTSMSGRTIEVLNTDAEGRLVLCDAITYANRFKPRYVIDIATLTGACVVALGGAASGLYANDDELADKLLAAGTSSRDRAWRMPLWREYHEQLSSPVADVANIGGAGAGSVTAACFLEKFAGGLKWAHFDVAGTAWKNKQATGRPVGLLCQFLLDECTGKP